jgi:hypothetical protein
VKTQSVVIDNLMMQKPTLARIDGFMLKGALVLRRLRRMLPFLPLE